MASDWRQPKCMLKAGHETMTGGYINKQRGGTQRITQEVLGCRPSRVWPRTWADLAKLKEEEEKEEREVKEEEDEKEEADISYVEEQVLASQTEKAHPPSYPLPDYPPAAAMKRSVLSQLADEEKEEEDRQVLDAWQAVAETTKEY